MLPGQFELRIILGDRTPVDKLAQAYADKPLKPTKPQEPCDLGLFSDDSMQTDIVEALFILRQGDKTA